MTPTREPCDRRWVLRLCAVLATLLAVAPIASADQPRPDAPESSELRVDAPVTPPPPPAAVTLRQGVIAGHLAIEISLSSGGVLKPASIAPDLSYGVTDDFTIGVIHSGSALTGFRGSAGWGVCVKGTDSTTELACHTPYTAGGVEALYSIARGSAALALDAGLIWSAFEPSVHTDLKLGFKLKMSEGNAFAWFSPNVWLALDDRFDRVVAHEHLLFLPISVWIKPVPPLALGVGTGVKGPLENFGDRMSIPIGVLGQYAIEPRISVGTSFVFGKMFAGSAVMDPGLDARVVQVWVNLSSE
jgi:hypothetical protein